MSTDDLNTRFEIARKLAIVYGFTPIEEKLQEFKGIKRKVIKPTNKLSKEHLQNISPLIKFYLERNLHIENEPMYVFHSNVDAGTRETLTSLPKRNASITLSIFGVEDSFADAFIISSAYNILQSLKALEPIVKLNTMGSRDTSEKYYARLRKALRKKVDLMSQKCSTVCNSSICDALPLIYSEEHEDLQPFLPSTTQLLTDSEIEYFHDVIEYLDTEGIPYEVTPELGEETQYGINTVFEIRDKGNNFLAKGGRYDTLPNHLFRRNANVVSITIKLCDDKCEEVYKPKVIRGRNPKVFFFHAGKEARKRSIHLLKTLRDSRIPVAHNLHFDKVSLQLEYAKKNYPYQLILGQEEVESGTIRIRRTKTKAIEIIKIKDIPLTLKKYLRE